MVFCNLILFLTFQLVSINVSLAVPLLPLKNELILLQNLIISSFGIDISEQNQDVPKLYWIPKLHKNPYKQRCLLENLRSNVLQTISCVKGTRGCSRKK